MQGIIVDPQYPTSKPSKLKIKISNYIRDKYKNKKTSNDGITVYETNRDQATRLQSTTALHTRAEKENQVATQSQYRDRIEMRSASLEKYLTLPLQLQKRENVWRKGKERKYM